MRVITKHLLGAIGLSFSVCSYAGDWSIGAFLGKTSFEQLDDIACFGGFADRAFPIDPNVDVCPNDTDGTALGLNVVYQFTDTYGVEAGYVNLDEYESSVIIGGDAFGGEVLVKPEVVYLAATGSIAISDRFALTGRVGYYDLDVEVDFDLLDFRTNSEEFSDGDLYAGASLDFEFTDHLTAQLRYDNFDIDAVSLGLKYKF